ncbi:MAG: hypothetical protein JXB46_10315 [Candidatus Eisenbacteria bacterium]|nr:hypothetical protein [Candidatus Eisenbacteria bacterium]
MRLRVLALVCAACLLLVMTGCGGGPKTYTNDDYSFSVEHPADWEQVDARLGLMTGPVDFSTTFAKVSDLDETSDEGDDYLTAALVMATRLPRELSESEFRTFLEQYGAEMKKVKGDFPGTGYSDVEVASVQMTELAGVPCLMVDMDFLNDRGGRQHDRTYMFGEGDMLYGIQLSAPMDRWPQDRAELEAIAQSFFIL